MASLRTKRVTKRFDQLAKRILCAVYTRAGLVESQREVAADAQQIDTWFKLDPALSGELQRIGLLGRMIDGPSTLFEAFHEAPGVDDYRGCVCKQLVTDRLDVLEARRQKKPRPLFPRLWLLAAGRPEKVIHGYGLVPNPSYPSAFLEGQEEERLGLVVLRELPRTRETLVLRLMGAGEVLREALVELGRLPEDAWERQVAMPPLLALRFEILQDPRDAEERELLMNTMELVEQWQRQIEQKGLEKGVKKGLEQGVKRGLKKGLEKGLEQGLEKGLEKGVKKALVKLYRARFGALPSAIKAALESMHDTETLDRWVGLFALKPAEEIAAALAPSTRGS